MSILIRGGYILSILEFLFCFLYNFEYFRVKKLRRQNFENIFIESYLNSKYIMK